MPKGLYTCITTTENLLHFLSDVEMILLSKSTAICLQSMVKLQREFAMKITKLEIDNFRGIKHTHFVPTEGMNVIIGENGAGKSTILDAIALALSWYTSRFSNRASNGWPIKELDVRKGQHEARISIQVEIDGNSIGWTIYGYRSGPSARKKGEYASLNAYLEKMSKELANDRIVVPLVSYYPTTRAFVDVPRRIRTKHDFSELNAVYTESLTLGADFRSFYEWFKDQEDLENELIARPGKTAPNAMPRLKEVREAIEHFTGFHDLRIKRRNSVRMVLNQNDVEIEVSQLSDGEQIYLALIGDIARRAVMAHPCGNPLKDVEGVVLIDEVELHLHPRWQREVLVRLQEVFPRLQFITTTHSPQVVGEIKKESSWIVKRGGAIETLKFSLGATSNLILEAIMNTPERNKDYKETISSIYDDINKKNYDEVAKKVEQLKEINEDEPEVVRIKGILRAKEILET